MFYTKGVRARVSRGEGESVFCTLTVTVNTNSMELNQGALDVRPSLFDGKCFCEASGHKGFLQQSLVKPMCTTLCLVYVSFF